MKTTKPTATLVQPIGPLGECLTVQSARRLLDLKADPRLQKRVDGLANKHQQGWLCPEELAEYGWYVSFSTFIAIVKSKARQVLNSSEGE